jgi:hypothetical protein
VPINNYTNAPVNWSVSPNSFIKGAYSNDSILIHSPATPQSGILTLQTGTTSVRKHICGVCQIAISGPDVIGNCSANYSISNLPSNTFNHQWSITACVDSLLDNGTLGCTVYRKYTPPNTFPPVIPPPILDPSNPFDPSLTGYNTDVSTSISPNINLDGDIFPFLPPSPCEKTMPQHATLRCSFILNGQNYSVSKPVQVGIPAAIAGVMPVPTLPDLPYPINQGYYYLIANQTYSNFITQYDWAIVKNTGGLPFPASGSMPQVYFPSTGTYTILLRVLDGCYWSPQTSASYVIYLNGLYSASGDSGTSGDFSAYPNPAGTTLSIAQSNNSSMSSKSGVVGSSGLQDNSTYQIIIYSLTGGATNIQRTFTPAIDGQIDIDTSTLPNGNYVVLIQQGNSIVQQINVIVLH